MTTRNLDALFQPRSIALIGASNHAGSVGQVLAKNLLESGFEGAVMPVNPHEEAVRSALAYARVGELPETPDLAVVATPAAAVPQLIADLGAMGCRAAVVISAGFEGEAGRPLRQAMLDAARPHLLRILGPNCLGFISPRRGINASFAHLTPKAGGLALVTQSGAIAAAALDWAQPKGIGFSHVVSIGDAADIDVGDLLDHLAGDDETKAILLYVESVTDARKFMSAGRIAARAKPVVVIKAGRSAAGAKAALTHTGALAGADAVYDAAIRRAGMLRVGELRELFDAVSTLSAGVSVSGDRLAILTNGGGAGVLAVDALDARGGRLAELSPATLAAIDKAASANWSRRNPADILGDAKPAAYEAALGAILADDGADAVLVMNCPVAVADSTQAAMGAARAAAGRGRKPVLTCWLGDYAAAPARRVLAAAGLPTHETPDEAVRAFMHLVDHRANQQLLLQTPAAPPAPPDRAGARAIVEAALAAGRTALTDPEARAVLQAYGVPVVESRSVADAPAAAAAAREMAGPFALKVLSHDISHKSDVGGVRLGLADAVAVGEAAEAMLAKVRAAAPKARIEGFVVEPMVSKPAAQELICGIVHDAAFGPVVLFGQGGIAAEVIADRAIGLPPLDDVLAREMIGRTRVARLLAGYRDRPPADTDALARVLIALSALAADLPEVTELDINPLLADAAGVLALDARMAVRRPDAASPRLAILPYPDQLTGQVTTEDGETLTVRAVRPQDAPKLIEMVDRSAPADVRLRFLGAMRQLSPELARRLSQIDYDRQMALVAQDASGAIVGVARLVCDPQGDRAEYALMVRSDRQKHGLGTRLLADILAYAKAKGLAEVWGDVARGNERMLQVAEALGFRRAEAPDRALVRVVRTLGSA
jgi:acetyltransferase